MGQLIRLLDVGYTCEAPLIMLILLNDQHPNLVACSHSIISDHL